MAAERVANSLNLTAIKKTDQYVLNILDNASQVALYKFNGEKQAWEKTEVEGALFVYNRSATPTSAFFIMNRLNMNNMMEPVTSTMEFKLQDPFLLYRNSAKDIFGIWFYDSEECKRLASLMTKLSTQTSATGSATPTNPLSPEMPKESQANASEEKVDIMQLFAKAQEKYNNQSKVSSSSMAAPHTVRTPPRQQITPEQREQQQKFLQQNQQQAEQLQKLFQTQDTQPKKQRAYSTPVPYLLGNLSPSPMGKGPPKGEVQQNGVSPGGEGKSSKRKDRVKSLALSDVKAPINSVVSGPVTRTQDDSAITGHEKPGAQRQLFQNERMEAKCMAIVPVQFAAPQQTTVVSQAKDSPQKPLPDQAGVAAASLMSPLAFQPSGKGTILTPPPPQPKQPPKMDIAPLTQDQLVQALSYLLKNDSEFVTKIHEAYFKSLQDKLPT